MVSIDNYPFELGSYKVKNFYKEEELRQNNLKVQLIYTVDDKQH